MPGLTRRITFFDGLRGLAALQVVVHHYTLAFAPGRIGQLRFAADGETAVYLFFLMSGFVLTQSFEKAPRRVGVNLLRRVIRLGLPALAATLLAAALVLPASDLAHRAAIASGSDWLRQSMEALMENPLRVLAADVSGLSLLAGYSDTGLIAAPFLSAIDAAINPPLWSLHIELWGSVWVLLLVWLRDRSNLLHAVALLGSVFVFGTNPLVLFTIACLYRQLARTNRFRRLTEGRMNNAIGLPLIVCGILLCTISLIPPAFQIGWMPTGLLQTSYWLHSHKLLGAAVMFAGVLIAPFAQRMLDLGLPRLLGRLSFPIYLVHWPVMITCGSFVYLQARPLGETAAAIAALAAGMAITFVCAIGFEYLVDLPAIRASRALVRDDLPQRVNGDLAALAPARADAAPDGAVVLIQPVNPGEPLALDQLARIRL